MLTPEQLTDFQNKGYLRLTSAFSLAEATAMQASIWQSLEMRFPLDRNEPQTWKIPRPYKLQHLQGDPVFRPIGGQATLQAIDAILGPQKWQKPWQWGQFLVSFPTKETWDVPKEIWHTDFGFDQPLDLLPGVLVFSYLSEVSPGEGGTGVVEGSHRLMKDFVAQQTSDTRAKMKRVRTAFMKSHPWLEALAGKGDEPDRIQQFMKRGAEINGIALQVAELIGKPGDVIIGHPWLLHVSSPNCGRRVKMVRVQRVHRQELQDENLTALD